MIVKFFNPGKSYLQNRDVMLGEIDRILSAGDLILREDLELFENNFAAYVGKKHCIGLNSGTDALYLSLWALGIGPGDEVIVPSHTFVATAQVVHQLGATLVTVDVRDNLLVHADDIVDKLSLRTRAIMPVHLTGDVARLHPEFIKDIAGTGRIHIVEDAAQALGARGIGYGVTQCWSFYPAKILGAYGDAGAITTDDDALAYELRQLRHHYKVDYSKWGINSRLDNLQAAVLNEKLKGLTDAIIRRARVADIYKKGLTGLPLRLPEYTDGRVWQDYVIRMTSKDEREALYYYLKDYNVETMRNDYPMPITKLSNAQKIEDETLRIPCNDVLTDEEVAYVISSIKSFYASI